MSDEARLTVYSDYVCPFCYLGRLSLSAYRASRDTDLAVEWHPFDLRAHKRGPDGEIDHSVEDGKGDAYFEQVRENVARLRDRYDATEMRDLEQLPDAVDSLDAQAASLYVQDHHPEVWPAYDDAIFEALWVDARDVGDVAVLADLATDVGLEAAAIRDALDDEDLRDRLHERFDAARREGVTAVPTFVAGEHAARGAVPPAQLARLVEGS